VRINEIGALPIDEKEEVWAKKKKNKVAGPDSIPIEFYQSCWKIVKADIIQLFDDFHQGRVDISRINYGIITLLPKVSDAARIQQFRPICLLNCLYKLITKTLTIRIEPFAKKLIHPTQSAFMKGRNIMSGVLALHEILHETQIRKECGVIFKIDFEKAYDKVNWDLLFTCLKARGFNETWCGWIKQVVQGGTVSVKINNKIGPYIKSYKGVRQGDPLSPILFNFVADCLTRMILQVQDSGLIVGLADHIIPHGVAVLQYADDTIICLKHDMIKARNMKLLLYLYEMMAGLKINFNKSEIVMINGDDDIALVYAEMFNCQIGYFPIKYLGVPASPGRLHVIDWLPLLEKKCKKT
jgi:hypothetical protein